MHILYKNLKGIFTGQGFAKKSGRHPELADADYQAGPLHVLVDSVAKKILQISREATKSDRVQDCTGQVATAGFIDSHSHALFGGSRWNEFFLRWEGGDYAAINAAGGGIRKTFRDTRAASDESLLQKLQGDLKNIQAEGVRVLEIKSGYGESLAEELRILRLIQRAKKDSPVEIVSTFLGLHAVPLDCDEATWTDAAIGLLAQIKSEGLAEYADSFPEKGFFSLTSARKFSVAALQHGLKIKIHADELTAFGASELGAELGAASVDHLQKISDRALELLGQSDTVATLLPATSFYLGIEYAPARKILQRGARVALATDYNPGTAPSSSIALTAKLAASQMKMSPAEILCALTWNAATAVNRQQNYGLVQENYHADFLRWPVQSENPLEEILLSGLRPAPS